MKILRDIAIIIFSLAISIIAGYFLYAFIEGMRLDLYCKEFREGLDCYQEGWVTFPVWLVSLVGGFVAALSIALVSILCPTNRARSLKITLVVGAALAFPLTLLAPGPIPFLVTVLSGVAVMLAVLSLTNAGGSKFNKCKQVTLKAMLLGHLLKALIATSIEIVHSNEDTAFIKRKKTSKIGVSVKLIEIFFITSHSGPLEVV